MLDFIQSRTFLSVLYRVRDAQSVFYTRVRVLYPIRSPSVRSPDFILAALAPGRLNEFALNMFLGGLNNYVKLNKYFYD